MAQPVHTQPVVGLEATPHLQALRQAAAALAVREQAESTRALVEAQAAAAVHQGPALAVLHPKVMGAGTPTRLVAAAAAALAALVPMAPPARQVPAALAFRRPLLALPWLGAAAAGAGVRAERLPGLPARVVVPVERVTTAALQRLALRTRAAAGVAAQAAVVALPGAQGALASSFFPFPTSTQQLFRVA